MLFAVLILHGHVLHVVCDLVHVGLLRAGMYTLSWHVRVFAARGMGAVGIYLLYMIRSFSFVFCVLVNFERYSFS